ncbi:hypothetical protein FH608_033865 [Nonomuraea phyllanthi]|uniref:Uncharacterized protein n=1 Tax=Nonomuraea phyllanthi TaxID=2219224 RepID=A0A5C4VZB6_9ACTN|nr:hypothetical protein [Nonomuraea phyllanthi]KAB8190524.1 hypothetical protein FH608_033865 [Nonomuraea phyllanthi]
MRFFWWVVAPVLAGLVLLAAGLEVVPAYTAQFGTGIPGTFTATEHECGGRDCVWRGDFVSDDGSVVRRGVGLAPGAEPTGVGDRVAATETGNRRNVYPRNGSADWLLITLLGTASLVVLVVWGAGVVRAIRRSVRRGSAGS